MAWYDKWQKEKYKVRGSVDDLLNEFPKEKNYKDGSDNEFTQDYIKRDVYIECASGNKIFCFTADAFNCRHHIYECELSSLRWSKLREFYNLHIGKESDYYYLDTVMVCKKEEYVNKKGETKIRYATKKVINKYGEPQREKILIPKLDEYGNEVKEFMYHDDLILEKIKQDGRLYDFIETDSEIFFKCDDMELLSTFMNPKILKKAKNPFHKDYLDWSNNRKAKVPDELLEQLKKIREEKFGVIKFGTKEALSMAQSVFEIDNKFLEKHKITERTKLDEKIKDTDRIIYHLGLWDKYLTMWQSQ